MGLTDKDKEVYSYCGEHESSGPKPSDKNPTPPSPEIARVVALNVLGGSTGSYRPSAHCQDRMKERNFDLFDMEYVIRNGQCKESEFVAPLRQHKYTFRGEIDGTALRQSLEYLRTTT